jgi:DNA-binding transcriptional MerR regulator
LRGKRFGFSLEEIRQLLDLYYVGDQQATQLSRTLDIARDRLQDMERQRAELDVAIYDLKSQMGLVEEMLATVGIPQRAAQ